MPKTIRFEDYPEFQPNLSPSDMFKAGIFGGGYFRDIFSSVTKKSYDGYKRACRYKCLSKVPKELLAQTTDKDVTKNKYKCKVGMSLQYWEEHNWIHPSRPYGWVEWYCGFYDGIRTSDDQRQIKRWLGIAGPKGRFKNRLINELAKRRKPKGDYTVLPKIRQILLTWGFQIN